MLTHNKELEAKERVVVDRAKNLWTDMRDKMKAERGEAADDAAPAE